MQFEGISCGWVQSSYCTLHIFCDLPLTTVCKLSKFMKEAASLHWKNGLDAALRDGEKT